MPLLVPPLTLSEGCGWGLVGQGSYRKVYAARDRDTGKIIGVKRQCLPSDEASREPSFHMALGQVATAHVQHMLDHFTQKGMDGGYNTFALFSPSRRTRSPGFGNTTAALLPGTTQGATSPRQAGGGRARHL